MLFDQNKNRVFRNLWPIIPLDKRRLLNPICRCWKPKFLRQTKHYLEDFVETSNFQYQSEGEIIAQTDFVYDIKHILFYTSEFEKKHHLI